jgi:glycosyltransferase involved in cell wall biosynthesis
VRGDLQAVAADARHIQHFIGIDPSRLTGSSTGDSPWPDLHRAGVPVALHVGHLRRNRGLDLLVAAQAELADRMQIVVQGSPTFSADPDVVEELEAAGVVVRRAFVSHLADLYRAADLYVFPVRSEAAGAIDLPLGVLEALACGRPVFTNEFGALGDALRSTPGVYFTRPEHFVQDLQVLLDEWDALSSAKVCLPDHLLAEHTTAAVMREAGGA